MIPKIVTFPPSTYSGSFMMHVAAPEKQQFSVDLLTRRKLLFLMSLAPLHHKSA
jgi:hypothetical protein